MFRIDSEHVVDATRSGGLARYCTVSLLLTRSHRDSLYGPRSLRTVVCLPCIIFTMRLFSAH